jgi:hypothetical protein
MPKWCGLQGLIIIISSSNIDDHGTGLKRPYTSRVLQSFTHLQLYASVMSTLPCKLPQPLRSQHMICDVSTTGQNPVVLRMPPASAATTSSRPHGQRPPQPAVTPSSVAVTPGPPNRTPQPLHQWFTFGCYAFKVANIVRWGAK